MSTANLPKILVILGPTASGKSDFAVRLAKKFNGEIVSADSRQIYKNLNIGANKISKEEKQGIKHYLLDLIEPDQEFSLYDWQQNAFKKIDQILAKKKLAIIVGGTGLYLSSILQNYQLPATDKKLREKLNKLELKKLVEQLQNIDPLGATKINLQNKIHVVRALEYAMAFADNFLEAQKSLACPYDYLIFGLNPEKEKLYQKINQRVDQMIDQGLITEVSSVYQKYKNKNLPALSGIGYQEIIQYLDQELSLEEAIELIKKNTRHYAKRQMTWFRRMEKQGLKINWNQNITKAESLIQKFLK